MPVIAVGEMVRRKSQPSSVGIVLGIHQNAQLGTMRARVKFGDTTREIPLDDLEPFASEVDMWTDLAAQRFAGATAFRKLMTYVRLSTRDPLTTPDTRTASGQPPIVRVTGQITPMVAA